MFLLLPVVNVVVVVVVVVVGRELDSVLTSCTVAELAKKGPENNEIEFEYESGRISEAKATVISP